MGNVTGLIQGESEWLRELIQRGERYIHMGKEGKPNKNNLSGVKGVCWEEKRKKWKAQIMIQRKCYNLGRYTLLEDAIKARRNAEIEMGSV